MWQNYIIRTLISYIALNAVLYTTKDNWMKLNPKKNGFFKRNLNKLAWCAIPIFRWILITLILIIGIALGNDEIANKVKKEGK